MFKYILSLITIQLCVTCSAQESKLADKYNGTYNSPTNLFKNNNYLRISVLNDTTFAFTIIVSYDPKLHGQINAQTPYLIFGKADTYGIAKLKKYKNTKTWIGVADFRNIYHIDSSYFHSDSNRSFDSIVKYIENPAIFPQKNIPFQVYKFSLQPNKIEMKGIRGVARFFEIGNFHKIDDSKMLFKIDRKSVINLIQTMGADKAIIKQNVHLIAFPDKSGATMFSGLLQKGDTVFLGRRDFMQYTFVMKKSKDENSAKYGWILRDLLIPMKLK